MVSRDIKNIAIGPQRGHPGVLAMAHDLSPRMHLACNMGVRLTDALAECGICGMGVEVRRMLQQQP